MYMLAIQANIHDIVLREKIGGAMVNTKWPMLRGANVWAGAQHANERV